MNMSLTAQALKSLSSRLQGKCFNVFSSAGKQIQNKYNYILKSMSTGIRMYYRSIILAKVFPGIMESGTSYS